MCVFMCENVPNKETKYYEKNIFVIFFKIYFFSPGIRFSKALLLLIGRGGGDIEKCTMYAMFLDIFFN